MRTALTIGYTHGGEVKVLALPDVDLTKQKDAIKELRDLRCHEELARVELWESGSGITKHKRFERTPKPTRKGAK